MTKSTNYLPRISFSGTLGVLLFMYPLFATVMRHWNSALFGFIMLLSLVYFFTRRRKDNIVLHQYEKIFLWLLAGNFIVFVLASLIHTPDKFSDIRFDIELRFLLIIPVYFLLLRTGDGFKYLVYGAIASIFIALGYAIYTVVIMGESAFTGVYSPLYTGPINLIYATLAVCYLLCGIRYKKLSIWLLVIGLILAVGYVIIYTHSRVTYISLLIVAILIAGFYSRKWWKLVSVAFIILIVTVVGLMSSPVTSRMSVAYQEFVDYLALSDTDKRVSTTLNTSVGTRLEMWRAAPLVLRDYPLVGVGNGNYNKVMQVYVANKELNPAVVDHSHAHNVFVNVLIVKGLLGLMITCLVLFYPLYIYIRTFKYSQATASTGAVFISLMFLISMNETAPFVKSNFVATFLLISAVLFQYHLQQVKSASGVNEVSKP